ncbi:MAG: hypothetical protein LBT40_02435 [Deltaproteobacteria bacterium]|nr:hypothetical protein [Deltaproteobacteria bacterium]
MRTPSTVCWRRGVSRSDPVLGQRLGSFRYGLRPEPVAERIAWRVTGETGLRDRVKEAGSLARATSLPGKAGLRSAPSRGLAASDVVPGVPSVAPARNAHVPAAGCPAGEGRVRRLPCGRGTGPQVALRERDRSPGCPAGDGRVRRMPCGRGPGPQAALRERDMSAGCPAGEGQVREGHGGAPEASAS